MNKITLIFLLSTTYIFSNMNALVSILPQQTFVKAIGGDKMLVSLIVKPGIHPHIKAPKPPQLSEKSESDLFFIIDLTVRQVWESEI